VIDWIIPLVVGALVAGAVLVVLPLTRSKFRGVNRQADSSKSNALRLRQYWTLSLTEGVILVLLGCVQLMGILVVLTIPRSNLGPIPFFIPLFLLFFAARLFVSTSWDCQTEEGRRDVARARLLVPDDFGRTCNFDSSDSLGSDLVFSHDGASYNVLLRFLVLHGLLPRRGHGHDHLRARSTPRAVAALALDAFRRERRGLSAGRDYVPPRPTRGLSAGRE
jgi:hypothetical protein